ncbi:MAG TPA: outer membrane beta-barrel protein [Steroidobacteraceae bacterium]|nr:outer membrane beta-barrel protein [Steroidobacteraceae bacterium]
MSRITWAAVTALGLISSPAFAAGDQGFYAGVGVGELSVDFSEDFDGTTVSFDDGDTSFRVFGGWQFNEYFSAEAGYLDGGTASETFNIEGIDVDFDIDVSGFDVLLRGTAPLGESFFVFAQAGMIFWDADLSASAMGLSESASDSGEDPAYGAGIGFNLGENAGVRIEYMLYDISDTDVESIMASFFWKFN